MRRTIGLGILLVVIVMSAGCAPANPETPVPTEPPTKIQPVTVTIPVTDVPAITETPVVIPITGPSMEVGSTYSYIDGSTLVAVPGGDFVMGADGPDNPKHSVTLNDFWVYLTKVTNQQYALCVKLGKCTPPDLKVHPRYRYVEYANHPVVGVTYEQAAAYCSFVNGRLPTEAEWEKAARGPDGNVYPWGNADPTCDLANFLSCETKPTHVMKYPQGASYYGALDMSGNVFEWVADWYAEDYYQNSPTAGPTGPATGSKRSIRSSGYESGVTDLIVSNRYSDDPVVLRADLGFRCVVDEPNSFASFCAVPPIYEQGNASETCPNVEINQFPGCSKKLATTNVGFVGPSDATIDSGVCAPTNDPLVFTCIGAGAISISASCQVDISGEPACPSGYSWDGSSCLPDVAADGACLPGMKFDSTAGCCVVDSANVSSIEHLCPVGTYYVAGQNICASEPLQGIVTTLQTIQLKSSCAEGGQGKSCQPPADGCGYRMEWDPIGCKCIEWQEPG